MEGVSRSSSEDSKEILRFIYFSLFHIEFQNPNEVCIRIIYTEKRKAKMNFFPLYINFNKINFKLFLILIFLCLSNQKPESLTQQKHEEE